MKKLLVLLAVSVLVLTGCSKNASLGNSTNVATIEGGEVSTDEVFQVLKENGILTQVLSLVDKKILSQKFPLDGEEFITSKNKIIDEANTFYTSQYGKSLEEMLADNGMTMADFDELIIVDVLRELAVREVFETKVTDSDIQAAYDSLKPEIKASHILITPELVDEDGNEIPQAVAEAAALEEAKALIVRLNNGEDFAELAKENSSDGSAANGGDLGFFTFDRMVTEFATAAFDLELNTYTAEPVKSQFGYHIILKTDVKDVASIDEMKEELKSTIVDTMVANTTEVELTLHQVRKDAGLKFEDADIEKEYNDFINSLTAQ